MSTKDCVEKPKKLGRPVGVSSGTRSKIINAALLCFAEKGYAKASNREIARRSGLTSGSLYHYFDSKAALYRAALHDVTAALVDEYRSACREAPDVASMMQLSLGVGNVIELSRRRPGLVRFAAASMSEIEHHDELDWLDQEDADAFPNFFRDLLNRAYARGELGCGIDIEAAVKVLIACISSLASLHGSLKNEKAFALVLRTFERMLQGEFMCRNVA